MLNAASVPTPGGSRNHPSLSTAETRYNEPNNCKGLELLMAAQFSTLQEMFIFIRLGQSPKSLQQVQHEEKTRMCAL